MATTPAKGHLRRSLPVTSEVQLALPLFVSPARSPITGDRFPIPFERAIGLPLTRMHFLQIPAYFFGLPDGYEMADRFDALKCGCYVTPTLCLMGETNHAN